VWNITGVILQVTIHRDDYLATGSIETGCHGSGLTKVSPKPDNPKTRVAGSQLL
jgi:hypothetical protein